MAGLVVDGEVLARLTGRRFATRRAGRVAGRRPERPETAVLAARGAALFGVAALLQPATASEAASIAPAR